MQQSSTVALIVVVAFGAGYFFGRSTAPAAAPAPTPISAPMNEAPTPFPTAAPRAPMMAAPSAPMAAPMMGEAQQAGPNGGPSAEPVVGSVQETIQVPNFTYLRLKTSGGEEWAAVPTNESLKAGDSVTIAHPLKMTGFTSKTLNRTFEAIWFGELAR